MLVAAILLVAGAAEAAGANVDRYQYLEYELTITDVNGNTSYWHNLSVDYDPDLDDPYSGTGAYRDGTETGSGFVVTDDSLSFQSKYDTGSYTWFPSFTLNDDGTLTFMDGFGTDNVWDAQGTYTVTGTEYRNHGQLVRESDDRSASAHSVIGMPTKSKKKK